MKGQFKKGKGDNVWYLVIYGDAYVLRKVLELKLKKTQMIFSQYDKGYMKIKFKSNDNLPIDSIVNMHQVIIIIWSVFAQNGKFYPPLFLGDALYEL